MENKKLEIIKIIYLTFNFINLHVSIFRNST